MAETCTVWSKRSAKMCFHATFIFFLRPQLLRNCIFPIHRMETAVESIKKGYFHTVDISFQSEWDGEELMLLTHSWSRCDWATDARSFFHIGECNVLHAKGLKYKSSPLCAPVFLPTIPVGSLVGSYQAVLQHSDTS